MECRLYSVTGLVQGVWFRESTRREAAALGITGYAKNMADGSVEVLACGDSAALKRLADWLEVGPPAARVARVECSVAECRPPPSFTTG